MIKQDRVETRKRILMITAENKEINAFRKKQFNNFIQITMPYLAGFIDESKYDIVLDELYEGYIWFRKQFYSIKSIWKRLGVSKTNVLYNLIMNLGYKLSFVTQKKCFKKGEII